MANKVLQDNIKTTLKGDSHWLVDFAKLFFCIGIVFMHCEFYICNDDVTFWIEKLLFRLGVPFFFVVSGYYLMAKIKKYPETSKFEVVKRYCLHLLHPMIIIIVLHTAIEVVMQIRAGTLSSSLIKLIQSLLFYPPGAMWYIEASIVGALFTYPFIRYNKMMFGLAISLFLYLFALLCNNYYNFAGKVCLNGVVDQYMSIFISARNGVFVGFTFLLIGMWLYKKKGLSQLANSFRIVLTILAFSMYIGEVYVVSNFKTHLDDGSLYISYLFLIPLLVCSLIGGGKIGVFSKYYHSAILCRKFSTYIYFVHRLILRMLIILLIAVDIELPTVYISVIVVVMSILASYILMKKPSLLAL